MLALGVLGLLWSYLDAEVVNIAVNEACGHECNIMIIKFAS